MRRFPFLRAIARIGRLWRLHGTLDLVWVMGDRKQFVMYYLSDLLMTVGGVTGIFLLAERFQGIGRWSRDDVLFMLGYGLVVEGIIATFFNMNVAFISRRIGRGQLDHMLIQPQPLWMALLTEGFLPIDGTGALLTGVAVIAWVVRRIGLVATPGWILLASIDVVSSVAIVVAFSFLVGSLAFWAPRGAEEISSSAMRLMSQLKGFPLGGLSRGIRAATLTIVPVGFVSWLPSASLLGLDRRSPAVTPAAGALLASLAAFTFLKGLQQYGRTGSQRYLSFGHRR